MKKKTFYQQWNENAPGFTNLGSFHTTLMQAYRAADNGNREKLAAAFPEYFEPGEKKDDLHQAIEHLQEFNAIVKKTFPLNDRNEN